MKKYIRLNHKIVFYVPSTNKATYIGAINYARRITEVANHLTKTFGGATLETVKGYWKSSTGEYITEDITKVISFSNDENLKKNLNNILNYAKRKQLLYNQEALSIEIDNEFILID